LLASQQSHLANYRRLCGKRSYTADPPKVKAVFYSAMRWPCFAGGLERIFQF